MFMYLHRASWHSSATLTDVFPCFFLSFKANARVKTRKDGHSPHSSYCVVLCIVRFVSVCVLLVCKFVLHYCHRVATNCKFVLNYCHRVATNCKFVLNYCHRVATQLQLIINISIPRGCQFIRLLAAEVCASAVAMLDTPCSDV
jgi:hypothetical protein